MRDVHGTDHQFDRAGEQEELLGRLFGTGDVREVLAHAVAH